MPDPSPSPAAPGSARARRLAPRAAAVLGVALVVLLAPAVVAGSGRGTDWGSAVRALVGTSCASADSDLRVGLVVDVGDVEGGPGTPTARQCVTVGDRASGFSVLSAGGHTYRTNSSGLLCAIDGYPATGCGERTSSGYRYWSYWRGGEAWTYSSVGPAGSRPKEGSVEGWRFVDSGDENDSQPPRVGPGSPCPTSPPATVPPATTPSSTGSGGSGGTGPASGAAAGSGGAPAAGGETASTTAPVDGSAASGDTPSDDLAGGAPTEADGSSVADPAAGADEAALADARTASSAGGGSGVPLGVIAVAVVLVALGGSAAWRLRSRPDA